MTTTKCRNIDNLPVLLSIKRLTNNQTVNITSSTKNLLRKAIVVKGTGTHANLHDLCDL